MYLIIMCERGNITTLYLTYIQVNAILCLMIMQYKGF